MRLILESRYLFDASLAPAAHRAHEIGQGDSHHAMNGASNPHDVVATQDPAAGHSAPSAGEQTGPTKPAAERDAGSPRLAAEHTSPVESTTGSVLFVDPRVANWQTLAAGVTTGTKVIVLDPTQDGLAQVSAALNHMHDVHTVNFLTYGNAGQIELGSSMVDANTLLANANEVAGWRDHMADHAQILLWGCDVGAGSAGVAFVTDLHTLTGAGVAAATHAIGSAAQGGGWTLDQTAGTVTPVVPFSTAAVAAYQNVLDAPLPTVAFVNVPAQVLLGASFTETVSFTNAAASAAGYGPIIEVFGPNNTLDQTSLTSATYLGAALPVTQVTLSTTVAGHTGTLGALDPVIVDATGAPVFVTAPAGMVAGDSMYVVRLPFGSFTPGQPPANVLLNFTTSNTSVLTAQHGGQEVTIDAIGGFIYGADPLNNPGTDLPIQGTGGTQGVVTPATGEVSASTPLVLATVTSAVVTQPGEGETATGPDFPARYVITVTPAPATAGNPVQGTTTTIVLPDNIEYTGGPITVTGSTGTATFTPGPSTQGGTVSVTVPLLSASDGPTVISIPFFVPQTDASGNPILDPVTGAPTTVTSPVLTHDNGVWNPWAGSADQGSPYTLAGSITTGAAFTVKSLAMQQSAIDLATNSATQTFPNDEVQYTLKFEVSDFFNMNQLSLQTLLNDGLVIDPNVAPLLTVTPPGGGAGAPISLGAISASFTTVNGQLVPVSGGNANWNFVNSNSPGAPGSLTPGQTQINLDVGAALLAATGSATLGAGWTGTLTFDAMVLDKYTNTNIDPATNAPSSITELDTVSSSSTAAATVFTTAGAPTNTPPQTISDNSSNTLTVPAGSGSVFVAALNGAAVAPGTAVTVNAGDTVTYALKRTLATGDYGALAMTAFLPLPVLDANDPASNGTIVSSYSLDTSQPGSATFYPALGNYSYFESPVPGSNAPPYVVQSALVNSTSNSVNFDLGHRDDPTNVKFQTVTVYFTVKASTAPFADGLNLTTQGQTDATNGSGVSNSTEDITQITVAEPNLGGANKNGVVSLVNDAGVTKTIAFTVDGTATPADPTTFYAAAGTPVPTGRSLFVGLSNTGPTSIGPLQNLNVSGADGGDTVRIVETVANIGAGAGGAYDMVVSDTLPAGYSVSDVSNLVVVRSGTLTELIPQSGSLLQLFTAGGVTLEDPASTAGTPRPTLYPTSDALHRDVLTISFDLKLHADQPAGAVLTNTGKVLNYTNIYNGVALGNGFVVNGNPVGGTAADLIDTSTITTTAPALSKSFGPSDAPQNDNVDPTFPNATVVVGETRPVTVTVSLPEGSINNGTQDVFVTVELPANETFTGLTSIVAGSGVTLTPPSTPYSVSGNLVTFDLGPEVLNGNADKSGIVNINYTARFDNGSNANNTLFTSTANLIYSGSPVPSASVTFIEHDAILNATLTHGPAGSVYSGATLTYTYTITNSGLVDARDTASTLDLPAGLTYVPGTLHLLSQANSPDSAASVDDSAGASRVLTVLPGEIDASTAAGTPTLVYSFEATVNPGLAAGTDLTVTSPGSGNTALSIANSFARNYPFSASDPLSVGAISPSLFFAAEANGTTVVTPGTAANINVTVGDIARLHGVARIPEGSNANVVLDFTLPAGFVPYLTDGTAALALVSPNGSFSSSLLDPAGNTSGLQVTGGAGFNAGTFAPTYAVPASAIDTTSQPGHLLIRLGTLTNDAGSPLPNFAIVELNGQVTNVAANTGGATLTDRFAVQANGGTTASVSRSERVLEPAVTLAKSVTAIDSAAGSVTYLITLRNTSTVPAYNETLTDPLPGSNVGSVSPVTAAGGATGLIVTPGGGNIFAATMTLPPGATETFTYTLTVASVAAPVPASTTSETWQDINPAVAGLTYNGFTSTIGAAGGTTGSRDGSAIPGPGINNYWRQVSVSLGTASGQVWQALGNTPATYDTAIDTPLGGVLVTMTSGGLTERTTTASDGTYFFGLIPNGAFTVTLPASGSNGLPASETLVVNTFGGLTPPAAASANATGTALGGLNFAYEIPDIAPLLGNWSNATQSIAPSQVAHLSDTGATAATDAELATLIGAHPTTYSYKGAVLTVQRYIGAVAAANSSDVFGGDARLSLSGGSVVLSGAAVGSFSQAGGVLTLTFNSSADATTVQEVLNHLTYSNATTGTLTLNLTIGATLADGNVNNVPLATGFTGAQGTGGVRTSAPVFSTFTLRPGPNGYRADFIEPNNTPAAGAAITLPAVSLANLVASGASLSQVVVVLGGGAVPGEDVLAFISGTASGNIAGSFDAPTGTLTLTSAGPTASLTQWQAALGNIQYYDSNPQPNTALRGVTYSLTSTGGGGTTTEQLGEIAVSPTDDSPILNTSAPPALNAATEGVTAAPAGAQGQLVSTLANNTGISDLDGNNAHDGSAPGPYGLAVVQADTTTGNWWESTNNGITWHEFAGAGLSTISDSNALHLVANAATRIFFQPTLPFFNGAITPALTFRAWDQFDGAANGSLSALPADGPLGTGINLRASAYSAAAIPLPLTINAVNNAPIGSGTSTLPAEPEDTAAPAAETVAALFAGNFSDTADQQQTVSNPTGSLANTLAGVVITADTTPATDGVWRYSTDGGANWTSIPTSVSASSALVLPASAQIDFLPAPDFNGKPPPLTAHLVDNSTDVPLSNGVTGAALQAGNIAYTGVDVSGTNNGGATAVSVGTVPLGISVTPINDAPIASGSATLASGIEDTISPPAANVAALFQPTFSDTADQQQTPANPAGSVANTLAGVAIVGDTTPASEGVWRYSTDNGGTWVNIPTTVSNTSALVLPVSAEIDFLPVADFNGAPPALTIRDIDSSTDVPLSNGVTGAALRAGTAAYSGVDVSGAHNGGITAVSAATIPLNTSVTAVNDAPIASGGTALTPVLEDTTAPPGATVGTLFSGNFSDTADQQQTPSNPTGSVANVLAGVAITADTTPASQGVWRYSIDGGITWADIPTSVSDTSALVLSVSAEIAFLPRPDFNGAPRPLTARLIDSSTDMPVTAGVTGLALLTGGPRAYAGVDVSGTHNGGITAVSAASVSLSTAVTPTNDAPVASGAAILNAGIEDTTTPPPETVNQLFMPTFSDAADQQRTALNPTGSVANTLAGVAIVANATPASEGVWRYSTDGGVHWTDLPGNISESSALVLPVSAEIAFQPVADFNGAPLPLIVRDIDNSTDVPIIGSVTGAALQTGNTAYSGVDVSGTHNGGQTAISAEAVPLDTSVIAVNDAPIATGSVTLPTIFASNVNPPGESVAALFAPSFSDTADQQRTSINPTGSVANTLAGVVIVGNSAPASAGTWRYSGDGGATWIAIPTGLSDTSGLVLGSAVQIDFAPNPNFHGSPPPLQARLVDTSSDVPLAGHVTGASIAGTRIAINGVDVAGRGNGGATAVSAGIVPVNVKVIAAGNPVFPPETGNPLEKPPGLGGMPWGWLVGSTIYRMMQVEEHGSVNVSTDAFHGNDTGQRLSYEASTASGGPLPPWLSFDPATLSFSGVPPENAAGTLDLRVVARDASGRQASAEVHVFITRDETDPLGLLRALRKLNPEGLIATPVPHGPIAPEEPVEPAYPPSERPLVPQYPDIPGSAPPAVAPGPAAAAGRDGFSAQLRGQTLAGRLARHRALLSAIIDTAA